MISIVYNKDLFLLCLLFIVAFSGIVNFIAGIVLYGKGKSNIYGGAEIFTGIVWMAIVAWVLLG